MVQFNLVLRNTWYFQTFFIKNLFIFYIFHIIVIRTNDTLQYYDIDMFDYFWALDTIVSLNTFWHVCITIVMSVDLYIIYSIK